jgi:hypothetical protein
LVSVLSSLIASDCANDPNGVIVTNPGRALFSPARERERLRELGCPSIRLPDLVAVLTLLSDVPGPFSYRLSCVMVAPNGEVAGPMQMQDFSWRDGQRVERVSLRLGGQIRFFETGGIYKVRFLFDGTPLCEVPLPIFWDDMLSPRELAGEAT